MQEFLNLCLVAAVMMGIPNTLMIFYVLGRVRKLEKQNPQPKITKYGA
jgi:hypothetical protein